MSEAPAIRPHSPRQNGWALGLLALLSIGSFGNAFIEKAGLGAFGTVSPTAPPTTAPVPAAVAPPPELQMASAAPRPRAQPAPAAEPPRLDIPSPGTQPEPVTEQAAENVAEPGPAAPVDASAIAREPAPAPAPAENPPT